MADTSLSEKKIGLLVWKVSNYWQNSLRKVLADFNLSLNEYLVLESLYELQNEIISITQKQISIYSGIDASVISVCLKILKNKKLIYRKNDNDNRKKIIKFLPEGDNLFKILYPKINEQENLIFDKLKNEKLNFSNSLKMIIGRKIRIKAQRK